MTFVFVKFVHVAFMFLGAALAIGPAALLYMLARSGAGSAIRPAFTAAERVFQISTACYGLGIIAGFVAAVTGSLDLAAPWLITAYVLVALLGASGVLFDRWTKQVALAFTPSVGHDAERLQRILRDRVPLYLLIGMMLLIVAVVFVMVTKLSFLS